MTKEEFKEAEYRLGFHWGYYLMDRAIAHEQGRILPEEQTDGPPTAAELALFPERRPKAKRHMRRINSI